MTTPSGGIIRKSLEDASLLGIAALVGALMGVLALGFIIPIRWTLETLGGQIAGMPATVGTWVVLLPIAGALIVVIVRRVLPAQFKGHGVSMVMLAVNRTQGMLPISAAFRQWIGATATIASGGSAGPEGPIVTIGASIGSSLANWIGVGPQRRLTILGCAAAAGLAAVFNAPLTGMFFVLEVILREWSLRTVAPLVVASVISAATAQAILGGDSPLFGVDPAVFAGKYFSIAHAPVFAIVGVACGVMAAFFGRFMELVRTGFERLPIPPVSLPLAGAAILVGIALCQRLLGGAAEYPAFYGDGYPKTVSLLHPEAYESTGIAMLLLSLIGAMMLKVIATSATVGSGGSGGLFAPCLMLGALVGGGIGAVLRELGVSSMDPVQTAAVGMGAFVAASAHAPLAGALLVYEVTSVDSVLLPSVLAAVLAVVAARRTWTESVYTGELVHYGLSFGGAGDASVLRRVSVADLGWTPGPIAFADAMGESLIPLASSSETADIIVTNRMGVFHGVVTAHALRSALLYPESLGLMHVGEMARTNVPSISPDEMLDTVMASFTSSEIDTLPVVDGNGSVLGVVTRTRLLLTYRKLMEAN